MCVWKHQTFIPIPERLRNPIVCERLKTLPISLLWRLTLHCISNTMGARLLYSLTGKLLTRTASSISPPVMHLLPL